MPIRDLNQGAIALDSQIPFGDTPNGQDRRASLADLLALLTDGGGVVTQYAAPNVSGFAVNASVPSGNSGVWVLSTPTADFAALTLNLPAGLDGMEVSMSSTHAVTGALSVVGATVGAAAQPVNGAPATLAANGFFRLRFDGVNGSWYRRG